MSERFDAVIIGSGPGGYVSAIRAAQLGQRVAVVEADRPGGICLNWGCIPTKALLRNAELQLFQRAAEFGVTVDNLRADYRVAYTRSRQVADRMSKGVEFLFRKNKITLVPGRGTVTGPGAVRVQAPDGSVRTLEARAIVLATGAAPKSLPGVPIDKTRVISSDEALRLERLPPSVVVIGAGAVGVEFADVFAAYGVQVTIVEALPRLLPIEDEEISKLLARSFAKRKIDVRTGVKVQAVRVGRDGVTVELEQEATTRVEAAWS
jgi:dihydrolipoamide dehydrogenase